jgi:hypothetical protein
VEYEAEQATDSLSGHAVNVLVKVSELACAGIIAAFSFHITNILTPLFVFACAIDSVFYFSTSDFSSAKLFRLWISPSRSGSPGPFRDERLPIVAMTHADYLRFPTSYRLAKSRPSLVPADFDVCDFHPEKLFPVVFSSDHSCLTF